jgi:hypothetical protein
MASLPEQSDSTFEQQATNLVDHCRAMHHPTLPYPMRGLQIQLVIALDRYLAHFGRPTASAIASASRLVALVSRYVRLDILRRHQPHLVTLLSQSPP